jgi:hypothetical protein
LSSFLQFLFTGNELQIYVRFLDEQNVSAYAAQELQKIMPEVMPLCVAYEAALRWTVEDCATDVVNSDAAVSTGDADCTLHTPAIVVSYTLYCIMQPLFPQTLTL